MYYLQKALLEWGDKCFGVDINRSKKERAIRVVEEALELAQVYDITLEQVITQANHTYSRPVGNVEREFGGVGVSTLLLAEISGLDFESMVRDELNYIVTNADKIKAKQLGKAVRFDK